MPVSSDVFYLFTCFLGSENRTLLINFVHLKRCVQICCFHFWKILFLLFSSFCSTRSVVDFLFFFVETGKCIIFIMWDFFFFLLVCCKYHFTPIECVVILIETFCCCCNLKRDFVWVWDFLVSNAIGGENVWVWDLFCRPSNLLFNPLILRGKRGHILTANLWACWMICSFHLFNIYTIYILFYLWGQENQKAFVCNQNVKSLPFHSYNFQSIVKSILLLFVEEEHWSYRVFLCVYNILSDSHNSNWCKMKFLCHSFKFIRCFPV